MLGEGKKKSRVIGHKVGVSPDSVGEIAGSPGESLQ